MTETQNIDDLIERLKLAIANSKDPFLIKNWQRSIELLNNKKNGIHYKNNDSSFQRESKQTHDGRTLD